MALVSQERLAGSRASTDQRVGLLAGKEAAGFGLLGGEAKHGRNHALNSSIVIRIPPFVPDSP